MLGLFFSQLGCEREAKLNEVVVLFHALSSTLNEVSILSVWK